ncbi:MAG: hypothetical protein EXS35_16140 [Pedosphaera sp.]|nr:hypothetical protein [Pedosphaera sp.]
MAAGSPPLSYQWQFNGTDLIGQTNALLTIGNIPVTAAGQYRVIVSNAFGVVTSAVTIVTVTRESLRFDSSASGVKYSNSVPTIKLLGAAGAGNLTVLASTDLVSWTSILTNPPVVGPFTFTDYDATNYPNRYYRAVEGP